MLHKRIFVVPPGDMQRRFKAAKIHADQATDSVAGDTPHTEL